VKKEEKFHMNKTLKGKIPNINAQKQLCILSNRYFWVFPEFWLLL